MSVDNFQSESRIEGVPRADRCHETDAPIGRRCGGGQVRQMCNPQELFACPGGSARATSSQQLHERGASDKRRHIKKDLRCHSRNLFVSLPFDDGRLPTYSCVALASSSDCSAFNTSGDDDILR